jgi:CDP-paratose 2-epimerase
MRRGHADRIAVITGGAGFVATNVANRLLNDGWHVRLFDNLSRPGVEQNLEWLRAVHGEGVQFVYGDVRDVASVKNVIAGSRRVFHFAAQVAVTTSLTEPITDFEINAGGTLNLLEALRTSKEAPALLFTSTNKVYGHLDDLTLCRQGSRYEPRDSAIARSGVSEARPLDFHSPYGCSKGAADQYVLDYARTFGLRATVFRMSCIYGPHQFGNEDQGWVAHFLIQSMSRRPLTLYGDGLQVRDVLFVEDLVDAMMLAHDAIDDISGEAFNVGGGPANTISLLELIDLIEDVVGTRPSYAIEPWRPADQRYYVSDTSKLEAATGWAPRVGVRQGVERLAAWLRERQVSSLEPLNRGLVPEELAATPLAAGKVAS